MALLGIRHLSIRSCTSRQISISMNLPSLHLRFVIFLTFIFGTCHPLVGSDSARRFSPLRESATFNHIADFSLMFASQNFGSSQSGTLCLSPSICGGTFLLISPAQIDLFPESPFRRFDIIAVLVVRLWTANSCNIQDDGLVAA